VNPAARRLRVLVAWLLLAHLTLMWGVVLAHTHADNGFHQTCPACHQERVVSSQPAAVQIGGVELTPVFLGLTPGASTIGHRLDPVIAGRSPRGPPLPL